MFLLGGKLFHKLALDAFLFFLFLFFSLNNQIILQANEVATFCLLILKNALIITIYLTSFLFECIYSIKQDGLWSNDSKTVLWTLLSPAEVFSFKKAATQAVFALCRLSFGSMTIYKDLSRIIWTFLRVNDPDLMIISLEISTCASPKVILPGGPVNVKVFYQHY